MHAHTTNPNGVPSHSPGLDGGSAKARRATANTPAYPGNKALTATYPNGVPSHSPGLAGGSAAKARWATADPPAYPGNQTPRFPNPNGVASRRTGLWLTLLLTAIPFLLTGLTFAQDTKTPPRYKLYTKPDPAATGGITGTITRPGKPIEQILAIPYDAPAKVYKGTIEGADQRRFRFTGLPMRKYDLIVIFDNTFYEGLHLQRGDDTLTDDDRKKIDAIIQKSEPFFTHKYIHRLEGTTGRGNQSRAICTFLRAKGSELMWEKHEGSWKRDDFRRTFKLVILKDVGPGWQIVRARDLYPVWTAPTAVKPTHNFCSSLSRIRVADTIKDLGELDLTR